MNTNKLPRTQDFVFAKSLVLLLFFSFSKSLFSQNINLDKLFASDGATNDYYGRSISLSEEYLVVGAPGVDNIGAFYVYSKDIDGNWSNEQKLSPPSSAFCYKFGASVSIAGNTIVVGSKYDSEVFSAAGAAYVYEVDANGQWNFKQKLMATNPSWNCHFGDVVFNTTDYIVVNAASGYFTNIDDKSVYIFEKNQNGNWYLTQKIDPDFYSYLPMGTSFGNSISMYGDYLAIGEANYGEIGPYRGAVNIYKKNGAGTWEEYSIIVASDGEDHDYFGKSVSIYDSTLVVGAIKVDLEQGSVYVYELDENGNWGNEQKFMDSNNNGSGISVHIHGDCFIAGALGSPNDSFGAAYVYKRSANSEWAIEDIYMAFDPSLNNRFGWAVSIFDNELAIGAPLGNDVNNIGAVYVKSFNCSFSLECPENLIIETNTGTCEGLAAFDNASLMPDILDGCCGISLNQINGPANNEPLEVGSYEVSFEAVSAEGITDNCTFSIEVVDNEAPVALCQDLEFILDLCAEVSIQAEEVDFGSSDACGIASYNLSQTFFDESSIGTNPVELAVTDIHGNTATCNASITIEAGMQIDASALISPENITMSYGEPLELSPSIANMDELIFSWYVDGALYCTDCYSISIYPESNAVIKLIVEDIEGCFSYADAVALQLLVDYSVHIPSAFSPNYDGVNDQFQAYFSDGVERAYELQVRDRWGNIVFHQKGDNIAWDGSFRGQEAITGVYNYTLVFSLVNGTEIVETGDVYLMR
jgi:gliding motility-associated-like protein